MTRLQGGLIAEAERGAEPSAEAEVRALELRAARARREAEELQEKLQEQRALERQEALQHFLAAVSEGATAACVQAALRNFLGMEVTIEQSQRGVCMHAPKGGGLLQLRSVAEVADFAQVVSAVLEGDRITAARAEVAEQRRRMQEREATAQARRETCQDIAAFLAMQNHDTSWPVRLVALVPYVLPAVDSCRMFGEAVGLHSLAGVDLHGGLLADFWGYMAPVLLFVMPMISNRRRLPVLLRHNLNQAYIFQLLNYVALANSWSVLLIQACLTSGEALRAPELVHPTVLPGAEMVLLANALCVAYSAGSTLLGVVPEHIPIISREARRSAYHTSRM